MWHTTHIRRDNNAIKKLNSIIVIYCGFLIRSTKYSAVYNFHNNTYPRPKCHVACIKINIYPLSLTLCEFETPILNVAILTLLCSRCEVPEPFEQGKYLWPRANRSAGRSLSYCSKVCCVFSYFHCCFDSLTQFPAGFNHRSSSSNTPLQCFRK